MKDFSISILNLMSDVELLYRAFLMFRYMLLDPIFGQFLSLKNKKTKTSMNNTKRKLRKKSIYNSIKNKRVPVVAQW